MGVGTGGGSPWLVPQLVHVPLPKRGSVPNKKTMLLSLLESFTSGIVIVKVGDPTTLGLSPPIELFALLYRLLPLGGPMISRSGFPPLIVVNVMVMPDSDAFHLARGSLTGEVNVPVASLIVVTKLLETRLANDPDPLAPLTSNLIPLTSCPADVGFARRSVSVTATVPLPKMKSACALTGPSTHDGQVVVVYVTAPADVLNEISAMALAMAAIGNIAFLRIT
jgi:hypothetical protein